MTVSEKERVLQEVLDKLSSRRKELIASDELCSVPGLQEAWMIVAELLGEVWGRGLEGPNASLAQFKSEPSEEEAMRLASINRYESALREANKHSALDEMIANLCLWARESVAR